MKKIIISKNDSGQRLDKFLSKYMPSLPKSMLYKGIRKNCVRINTKHAKDPSVQLNEGDELCLYFKDEFFTSHDLPAVSENSIDIAYEDENLLIINKPSGLVVHADDRGSSDTLISRILGYLIASGSYNPSIEQSFTPALANRLDRNTSGLVIAAKNSEALREINRLIRERKIKKYYLCLAEGNITPKSGTLTGWLTRGNKKVQLTSEKSDGSKMTVTSYKVLRTIGSSSLVEVELTTGRTHQIRAQFGAIGHPIAGDIKYGAKKTPGNNYQALCCFKLVFSNCDGFFNYLSGRVISIDPENVFGNEFV